MRDEYKVINIGEIVVMKTGLREKIEFFMAGGFSLFFALLLINGLILLFNKNFVIKRVASKLMLLMINHKKELLEEMAFLMIRQPFIYKVIMEFGKERVVEAKDLVGKPFKTFRRSFKDNKKKGYFLEIIYR